MNDFEKKEVRSMKLKDLEIGDRFVHYGQTYMLVTGGFAVRLIGNGAGIIDHIDNSDPVTPLAADDEAQGAPFAWCFTDVNGQPTNFCDPPEHAAENDLRIRTPLYTHQSTKPPAQDGETRAQADGWEHAELPTVDELSRSIAPPMSTELDLDDVAAGNPKAETRTGPGEPKCPWGKK